MKKIIVKLSSLFLVVVICLGAVGIFKSIEERQVIQESEIGSFINKMVKIEVTDYLGDPYMCNGFYVSNDGNILTNIYTISGEQTLKIINMDGSIYTGDIKILGYDVEKDLILLDVEQRDTPYFKISSSKLEVGQRVYGIGKSEELHSDYSKGYIGSINEHNVGVVMMISPDCIGRAIINQKGHLVGITSTDLNKSILPCFMVPIEDYLSMDKSLNLTLEEFNVATQVVTPEMDTQ